MALNEGHSDLSFTNARGERIDSSYLRVVSKQVLLSPATDGLIVVIWPAQAERVPIGAEGCCLTM